MAASAPFASKYDRTILSSTGYSAYWSLFGQSLLAAAVGERAAYLWVLDGNERAIGFYRRHRFELDGATEVHPEGLHRRMVR